MTREQKLALILGFALVLVVGVLVSDHISRAERNDALSTDGLDTRLAHQDGGTTTLLVNQGAEIPAPINATPERRFAGDARRSSGGLFGIGDDLIQGAEEIGGLPKALKTTNEREDDVAEFRMDRPQLRADESEPARIYRVKPNDSLWGIADREYADGNLHTKLAEYNHDRVGRNGGLREGATILIPTKEALLAYRQGDEREVRRGSAPPRQTPRETRRDEPKKASVRTYVVKKGETLSEICQEQLGKGSRWREVVELNDGKIGDDGIVRSGQEILLPAS
jgi:nucleoid-associated protein YgaU